MKIKDSHSHIYQLSNDLLQKYLKQHDDFIVTLFNNINHDEFVCFKSKYPCRSAIGLHPWILAQNPKHDIARHFQIFTDNIHQHDFIGEIGIDLSKNFKSIKEEQKKYFHKCLEIAKENKKPIIIHAVKSEDCILNILKSFKYKFSGFVHAFQGSKEQMLAFVELGFKISIGPNLLKIKRDSYINAVKAIPNKSLLIESDFPGLSDSPFVLEEIVKKLADIKGLNRDNLIKITNHNFDTI